MRIPCSAVDLLIFSMLFRSSIQQCGQMAGLTAAAAAAVEAGTVLRLGWALGVV